MTDTKAEKASIDRLVSLGFTKRESIEAFLACDRDEALAALFMAQNRRKEKETNGAPGDGVPGNAVPGNMEEKKEGDIDTAHLELHGVSRVNESVYFRQFREWMATIFEDEELFYRYLLLFMKHRVADMESLEDIHYDEEFLVNIGMDHAVHRKRMMKAIGDFNDSKREFEAWWNETVRFKKYLKLFRKSGIWDLEELLMEIRCEQDIVEKTGIENTSDVASIWKHIGNLRMEHSLYSGDSTKVSAVAASSATNAYNPAAISPNVMSSAYPNLVSPAMANTQHMNYSAPPLPAYQEMNASDPDELDGPGKAVQEEGAVAVTAM